ncbi:MAG: sel1 repeat family protein [Tatlockia sp.]|nr:sel1 repeat family protein [Tatlockia sp.]
MRFVFQLILLFCITLPDLACVYRSNLNTGIICFREEHYREAFIHLKPAADKGQVDAQYAVGYMYYYGKGVAEDRKKACIWINRAAAAGQIDAIKALKIIKFKPRIRSRNPLDPLIYKHSSD